MRKSLLLYTAALRAAMTATASAQVPVPRLHMPVGAAEIEGHDASPGFIKQLTRLLAAQIPVKTTFLIKGEWVNPCPNPHGDLLDRLAKPPPGMFHKNVLRDEYGGELAVLGCPAGQRAPDRARSAGGDRQPA